MDSIKISNGRKYLWPRAVIIIIIIIIIMQVCFIARKKCYRRFEKIIIGNNLSVTVKLLFQN